MTTQTIIATATGPHLLWITSRAAGITALLLSSASVCLGLLMGGKLLRGRWADMRVTHEALALATLLALALHGLALTGDSFLHPSLADISIPFVGGYETFWTSTGIVAFWMMAILGLAYYARARIGAQRWRNLHRWVALAWLLGVAHSLGEGSDAGQAWFLAMTAIAVVPALVLLAYRHLGHTAAGPSPATATPAGAARATGAAGQRATAGAR
jgi:methionine sulfoxide reductase heme-binding subunit